MKKNLVIAIATVGLAFVVDPSWWLWWSLEEPDDTVRKTSETAWAALKKEGIIRTTTVEVVEFGNGLGLRLNATVTEGHTVLEVPEEFAFTGDAWAHLWKGDRSMKDTENRTNVFYGIEPLVAEVAVEFWIGNDACKSCNILRPLLPTLDWISNHGLFSLAEEFPLLTQGTSMENWLEMGVSVTNDVYHQLNNVFQGKLSLDQVRWAYLVTMAYSTRPRTLDRPTFLVPLILARPHTEYTPLLHHDKEAAVYKFVANMEIPAGNEFFAYDPTLSDASALCYRGLWFTRRHRMELQLQLRFTLDDDSSAVLEKYECVSLGSLWTPVDPTKPLVRLFVSHLHRQIPKHFMSCLRLLAASKEGQDGAQLRALEKRGYMEKWPETAMISQTIEVKAASLALLLLQEKVEALMAGNKQVRETFGADNVAARPTTKVREAETLILVSLLNSMNELHMVVSSHDLYAQLKAREP